MKKLLGFVLSLVAVLALVSAAAAQMGIAAGAHGGYAIYSAEESNGGMDFGLNVNMSFMPMFSAQLFADYFFYTQDSTEDHPVELDVKDIPIGLHLMYNISIPGSPIKPYIGAGASIHLLSFESANADTNYTKFGVGGVGGAEFMATPQLGIFLEVRDHYVLTKDSDVEGSKDTNALYILLGVNYHIM